MNVKAQTVGDAFSDALQYTSDAASGSFLTTGNVNVTVKLDPTLQSELEQIAQVLEVGAVLAAAGAIAVWFAYKKKKAVV